MKNIKRQTYILIFSLLLSSTAMLFSCAREKTEEIDAVGKGASLKISLTIPDYGPEVVLGDPAIEKLSSRAPKLSSMYKDLVQEQNDTMMYVSDDFDALISSHFVEEGENEKLASVSGKDGIQNKVNKTAALMDHSKLYRLIIYNIGDSDHISNTSIQAGEDPDISLTSGKPYRWVAFSVNSETDLPNINGSNEIEADDIENKDLLYASGTITPVVGNNYLNISFERKMAKVVVDLNTRGLFGLIEDDTEIELGRIMSGLFTPILTKATFDVLNNSFSGTVPSSSSITGAQMTVIDPLYGNGMKRAEFYSTTNSTSVPENNLRVRLNKLDITLDNGETRTFAANTLVPINHDATTIQKGKSSIVHIRLVESGVEVPGNETTGVKWARTNMIYHPANPDKYRLLPNNNVIEEANIDMINHYWNYNVLIPNERTTLSPMILPPCSYIYPDGTWRLPSADHFIPLADNLDYTTIIDNSTSTQYYAAKYARKPGTPVNTAYPDNDLVFPLLGYRNYNQNQIINHPKDASGNNFVVRGNYWTGSFSPGPKKAGFFEIRARRLFGGPITWYAERQLGDNNSRDVNEGVSMRCVRNRNY